MPAVFDVVLQRIEAADQERGDAEVVIIAQRLGDLFRRADQAGRVAARAGRQRRAGPQPFVEPFAHRGGGQQAARSFVRRLPGAEAGFRAQFRDALLDAFGARPGLVFGGGEDGAEGEAETQGAANLRRLSAQPGRDFPDLGVGFAPERINVGMFGADTATPRPMRRRNRSECAALAHSGSRSMRL